MSELREAVIDAGAIERNTRELRRLAHTREFIAVVKADGYGHGAVTAARAALAGGATRLGVADLAEAHELRGAGIDAPVIAWLHGPDADFARAAAAGVELGVSSVAQLQRVAAAGREVGVHLKLETGLGRNGAAPDEWEALFDLAADLQARGAIRVEGLFSHLSGTSPDDDRAQVRVFEHGIARAAARGVRPVIRHLAATAAAITLPETRFDAVRVGIGLYGLSPLHDLTSAGLRLTPAMTLRTRVAAVRRVAAGHGASYGYLHRAERETTFALVPLGYADGIPRQASGRGPVTIGGRRFTVAGRIAMDQFVVDVGDAPVAVGDEVVLFGDPATGAPAVEEWAAAADTINYEIVTRIGNRVVRTEV
ncbi:alanine racemase [Microbacterium sediminis]|uniref:Alanine racemase n=1 Tax=Microbacterium sediminis TaxID=904291 RepID=A0A1B9NDE2_9MICO|nr:alanine racemase [Microbacterium sediminis]OCG74629.1 alanine racemase [Microbacterium sediminis]QBR74924.1 alanine racemase [Microbacterium sediminis]